MASRSSTTSIAPAYRAVAPGALATTVTSAPSRLAPSAAQYPAMPPPMTMTRLKAPRTPRQRRDEATLGRSDPAGIGTKRRHELVRFDGDVGCGEAERSAHPVARLDRARQRILAPQQPVRGFNVAQRDQTPHVRAVQGLSIDEEPRHLVHQVTAVAKPARAALALATKREVEPDHPPPHVHHRGELVDEFLGRQRGQCTIESQHDRVLDAVCLDQRQLLLQSGDRLRAVGGVEQAARVWFERDQGRLRLLAGGRSHRLIDHLGMAEMDAVETADGERNGADRARWQPEVNLQLRTFSGTKVRRSGSVWPSATRRPVKSWARMGPGPGSGSTRTARPWRTIASCSTLRRTRSMSGSMTSAGSSRSRTSSGLVCAPTVIAVSTVSGPYAVRTRRPR